MNPFGGFFLQPEPKEFQLMPCILVRFHLMRKSKSGSKYIKNLADIDIIPNIEQVLTMYKEAGYINAFLGNDSRVGKGEMTLQEFNKEIARTMSIFVESPFETGLVSPASENGNGFPYNYKSMCAYPQLGILGVLEYNLFNTQQIIIDWTRTIFLGKGNIDKDFAERAKIKFIDIDEFLHPEYNHVIG